MPIKTLSIYLGKSSRSIRIGQTLLQCLRETSSTNTLVSRPWKGAIFLRLMERLVLLLQKKKYVLFSSWSYKIDVHFSPILFYLTLTILTHFDCNLILCQDRFSLFLLHYSIVKSSSQKDFILIFVKKIVSAFKRTSGEVSNIPLTFLRKKV